MEDALRIGQLEAENKIFTTGLTDISQVMMEYADRMRQGFDEKVATSFHYRLLTIFATLGKDIDEVRGEIRETEEEE